MIETIQAPLRHLMTRSERLGVILPAASSVIAYTCVYLFRYPIYLLSNSDYGGDNESADVKLYISLASVIGMALAKYHAIRVISVLKRESRLYLLLVAYVAAAILTTLPIVTRTPWMIVTGVFLGAFPSSWLYGAFLTYIEGRRSAELLNACLNGVVVFGSATARAVGTAFFDLTSPSWMPLMVVCAALPIYVAGVIVMDAMPEPSQADQAARSARKPMPPAERTAFLKRYWFGLTLTILGYVVLLGYRSFRDFFAVDIYSELLGRTPESQDYLIADWPGGILACFAILSLAWQSSNKLAVLMCQIMTCVGALLISLATIAYTTGAMAPTLYSVACGELRSLIHRPQGCGLFLAVAPFSGSLYDRLVAATGTEGTCVFLVFMADGLAYVGTVAMLLYKLSTDGNQSALGVFTTFSYATGILSTVCTVFAVFYFRKVFGSGGNYRKLSTNDRDSPSMEESSL
eukprot:TRINITY_DN11531_c1_g1_i4.p1 TRINITY_DN11531_c1_g1~~TRINITY_DN11531_c1_g1_i4.p1  ORF type:complete len:461 (+),score=57.19 TRINITY_DN11531_c1_g1_i4:16-1398(+)